MHHPGPLQLALGLLGFSIALAATLPSLLSAACYNVAQLTAVSTSILPVTSTPIGLLFTSRPHSSRMSCNPLTLPSLEKNLHSRVQLKSSTTRLFLTPYMLDPRFSPPAPARPPRTSLKSPLQSTILDRDLAVFWAPFPNKFATSIANGSPRNRMRRITTLAAGHHPSLAAQDHR